jgi:crossover junction endodeoxyribonuclease RusA
MIEIDDQLFGIVAEDDKSVLLTLPIPPSANRYWRSAGGRVYVSEEAQKYKNLVKTIFGQLDPFEGNIAVEFTVYRARKKGDLDNYIKVMLDALKGIVYPDDDAVIDIHAKRKDDKTNPRVVFSARRMKA